MKAISDRGVIIVTSVVFSAEILQQGATFLFENGMHEIPIAARTDGGDQRLGARGKVHDRRFDFAPEAGIGGLHIPRPDGGFTFDGEVEFSRAHRARSSCKAVGAFLR